MIKLKKLVEDDKKIQKEVRIPVVEQKNAIEPPKCDLITRLREKQECENCE